jgi:flagellar motor switch protein FliG
MMFVHPRVAAGLLSRLTAGEVTQIGIAMRRLERLSPELIEEVVAEFVRDLSDVVHLPHSGRDFALKKLPELVREEDREAVQTELDREVGQEFQEFIAGCLPSAVAIMLRDEHPQARATALLMMGPDNATNVLSLMLDREQVECTRRMARIQSIDAKTARDVQHSLREALGTGMIERLRFQGVDQTARILCRMGKKAYEPLLKKIASRDAGLADAIRKRMVRFEDLHVLDRRGIQALLKEVDSSDLVVALRGADKTVLNRFLENLSKRRARDLVEEISLSGALPMRKVREAREQLVQTAMRLHEEGALFFPVGGEAEEMI